jgi:hypothetical protein
MTRLPSELHRLYLMDAPARQDTDPQQPTLCDAQGCVRAMVLSLGQPADWRALSAVWQGVQIDLGLPAPAIAVSGTDAYQLWFSLAEPLLVAQAIEFLTALSAHYLRDIAPERIALMPSFSAQTPPQIQHAPLVPAEQAPSDQWSAFVAPDLAPVFAQTPWLDIPPNLDGQADLLASLSSIPLGDLQRALVRLGASAPASLVAAPRPKAATSADPRGFLLEVMNNDAVALALRIEAAKALLPYAEGPRRADLA